MYPFPKERNADFINYTNNANKVSLPGWGIPDGRGVRLFILALCNQTWYKRDCGGQRI